MDKDLASEKGQGLVEFALIVPILFLLILGIIQFGSLYSDYLVVQHATREGARAGIVGKSDAEIFLIINDCASHLDQTRLTATIDPSGDNRINGDVFTVRVNYRVPVTLGMLQPFLGNEVQLSSQLKMRL